MCTTRRVLIQLCVYAIVNADNLNKPATESKPDLEVNITNILNIWESKFLDKLITYIDSKTDAVNNKIPELEGKIIRTITLSNKNIEEKIDQISNVSINKIHVLEVKITESLNTLKKELLELNRTLNKVDCGKLPPLLHGSVELVNGTTQLGSVVQYSCATNYQLVGPAQRTCTEDFQWSDSMPTCEVDCGMVPALPHGSTELLNSTTHLGSVVQYSCATNYQLVGPARRSCAEDFQWSETAPTCEVDCGKLPFLRHQSAELLNGTTHLGSVVKYSCATNYRLVGPARRTCTEDFQWSETTPTCEGLCKEEAVAKDGETPWYSLDDVSLNNFGTVRRDYTGQLTYLELHFAVQTDGVVSIKLKGKEQYFSGIQCTLEIRAGYDKITRLWCNGGEPVASIDTPDILFWTQFRSFYIKIENDKLQFGKEGEPPLISYYNDDFGSLLYYQFDIAWGSAKIRYCPVPNKVLPCDEFSFADETPWYSMDDVSLNHNGTLKRDSTGHRTHFELHFAIQTYGVLSIWLTEKRNYMEGIKYQLIFGGMWSPRNRTELYRNNVLVQEIATPDLVSMTEFSSFYIRIDDGKLLFGKEGDAPLILYFNANIGSLNYYYLHVRYGLANISYCPDAVEAYS